MKRLLFAFITALFCLNAAAQQQHYKPRFKVGDTAIYHYERKQSKQEKSGLNPDMHYRSLDSQWSAFAHYSEGMYSPNISQDIKLTVLEVTPYTTTFQLEMLNTLDASLDSKEQEIMSILTSVLSRNKPILTYSSRLGSYLWVNKAASIREIALAAKANDLEMEETTEEIIAMYESLSEQFGLLNPFCPALEMFSRAYQTSFVEGKHTEGKELSGNTKDACFTQEASLSKKNELNFTSNIKAYQRYVEYINEDDLYETDNESDNEYGVNPKYLRLGNVDYRTDLKIGKDAFVSVYTLTETLDRKDIRQTTTESLQRK